MSQTNALPNRRSIRLPGYDYAAAGYYFVTLVTQDRNCLFGNIVDGALNPTAAGRLVQTLLDEIPAHYPGVELDARIVMPNHIHAIIILVGAAVAAGDGSDVGATPRGCPDLDDAAGSGRPRGAAPTGGDGAADGGVGAGPCPRPFEDDAAEGGRPRGPAPTLTLGDVIGRFKSLTTNRYAEGVRNHGWPPFRGRLWQRNYYEHIIRNDESLYEIRKYIEANPAHWAEDEEWLDGQTQE